MPSILDYLIKQPPSVPEPSPAQRAAAEARARAEQDKWSPTGRTIAKIMENGPDFLSGLFAGDPFDKDASKVNLMGQMASMAALPVGTGIKGLYSRLGRAIDALPARGKASSVINQLLKNAHPEEIEYTGVGPLLRSKGFQPVERDELIRQMEAKPLRVEVKKYGNTPWATASYAGYQMPGARNYRETLIKLPQQADPKELERLRDVVSNQHYGQPYQWLNEANRNAIDQQMGSATRTIMSSPAPDNFVDPHFPDDPNLLVHVRTNERRLHENPDPKFMQQLNDEVASAKNAATESFNPDSFQYYLDARRTRDEYKPLGQQGRVIENLQSKWHQKGARKGIENMDRGVPDAPFKDNRWVNLGAKQQIMDVANNPNLGWIGVAPSSFLKTRGEDVAAEFQDTLIPNTIDKILRPFGGKPGGMTPIDLKRPTPDIFYKGNGEVGPNDAEPIASMWPKWDTPGSEGNTGIGSGLDFAQTVQQSQASIAPQVEIWLARMTPAMKAEILAKGLSLEALYLMMQQQGQESSQ